MATMKIPYTYSEYKFSKLGTRVDRFCHSPSRIVWGFVVSMLLCVYYVMCFSVIPVSDALRDLIGKLAAVLMCIFIVSSFFLGILCDKCRLSERVALWDLSGRKVTGKMKVIIVVLAAVLLLPGITAAGVTLVTRTQENAYHKTMAVLEESDSVAVEGNKAVTYKDGRFSTRYIPEDLQAETPEKVQYIVQCTDGEELSGFYGTSGIAGYRRWRMVEVVDRESGQVIATETFFGTNPPHMVSDDDAKKQYGSEPSDEEISTWVTGILSAV